MVLQHRRAAVAAAESNRDDAVGVALNGKTSAQQPFDDLCPAPASGAASLSDSVADARRRLGMAPRVPSAAPSTAQVVTSDIRQQEQVALRLCVDELRNLGCDASAKCRSRPSPR